MLRLCKHWHIKFEHLIKALVHPYLFSKAAEVLSSDAVGAAFYKVPCLMWCPLVIGCQVRL